MSETIETVIEDTFNDGLLGFLRAAPTPFHAVQALTAQLSAAGYTHLQEREAWALQPGGRYFVTRNASSLIAFRVGDAAPAEAGLRMAGAHTDSPCLKIKPQPELLKKGYFHLGVEVYGGVLLNPWFDRDLSIAGRVSYQTRDGALRSALIDFGAPVAVIPSLAIHLDKQANEQRTVNAQNDIPPLLMQVPDEKKPDFRALLLDQLNKQHPDCGAAQLLDYDLNLYDTQPPARVGLRQEFIASARLDNLLSCYVGLQALLAAEGDQTALLVCNDHEEIGNVSAIGAHGNFLRSVLERICGTAEGLSRAMDRSLFVSADNAHGVHPNFPDKHDANHGPLLNKGVVIKTHAAQRYASSGETMALFRLLCREADVAAQSFAVRSDMGCGSTLGPVTASRLGVRTLDVGVPTFAMHSIRELAGRRDAFDLYRVLRLFFAKAHLGL